MFENEELDSIVLRMRTFVEQSNFMDDRKYLLSLFQKVLFVSQLHIAIVNLKQTVFIILYMIFNLYIIPLVHQMSF